MARTLLLADKSPTIRRVIELTFSGHEIAVASVANGDEAIAAIAANPPDIVLADAAMRPRDGYDVASFVKHSAGLARIPVIVLTAAFEGVDAARAAAAGCDAVLAKPFELGELVWKVEDLLARASDPLARTTDASDADDPADEACDRADADLDDRFDAIDAALSGGTCQGFSESGHPVILVPARDEWWCSTAHGRLSLEDFFDRVDDASFGSVPCGHLAAVATDPAGGNGRGDDPAAGDRGEEDPIEELKRAFLALLDGASRPTRG
jgi:CheY-like chemotaxis protein